jgi:hypothetical protein
MHSDASRTVFKHLDFADRKYRRVRVLSMFCSGSPGLISGMWIRALHRPYNGYDRKDTAKYDYGP